MTASDPAQGSQGYVVLRAFRDFPEALVAKGILDSAGIESVLGDANTIRMDWLWSNLLGGIKLWVKESDAEEASELLDQKTPERFNVDKVGEFKQPRCPKCESLDVSFEELNKNIAHPSVLSGIPLPLKRKGWKCHTCGHAWQEPEGTTKG